MKLKDAVNFKYEILQGEEGREYTDLCDDTRSITEGCLFVCIKGGNFDSHDRIEEIKAKGAKGVVIEHECAFPEGIDVIKTDNCRYALSVLAAAYYGHPADKMTTIAITGTKGKTTTASMIKKMLEASDRKVGLIGTLGICIGDSVVPTLNTTPGAMEVQKAFADMVDAGCEFMVMEVSSQAVMMHRTAGIEYDYGVFTNISNDHIGEGEHKDFAEYLMYKTKLFDQVKHAFVNADDEHSDYVISHAGCSDIKTYGMSDKADYRYDNIRYVSDADFIGLEFDAYFERKLSCEIGIPGEFNAPNAMAALCVCKAIGVDDKVLETALKDIHVNGRMELAYSSDDLKVIVDFAHNAVSMDSLLKTLRGYEPKRLVVVFGCGGNRSKERRYDMGRIAGEAADFAVITEDNSRFEDIHDIIADIRSTFDKTGGSCVEVPVREEAVLYAIENYEPGDMIAIIGKGHEDYIEKEGRRTHYTDQEAVAKAVKLCIQKGIL